MKHMSEPTQLIHGSQEEAKTIRIGIIICARYRDCGGGKCFRASRERQGGFSSYAAKDQLQIVGYSSCGGCPGGNVEDVPAEFLKNAADVVHLATGLMVGYPPCPHIDHFCQFIEKHHRMKAVIGTHPIPQKYFLTHQALGTWDSPEWQKRIRHVLEDETVRSRYD